MPEDEPPQFRRMVAADLSRPDVVNFRCGEEPWADKVADELRSGRVWLERKQRSTKTHLYCADGGDGEVIGFATVGKKTIATVEEDGEAGQIRTMHIAWFAVAEGHQGNQPGGKHADNMMAELTGMAIEEGLEGFSAFVDSRNERAIRFWQKYLTPVPNYQPHVDADGSRNVLLYVAFPSLGASV